MKRCLCYDYANCEYDFAQEIRKANDILTQNINAYIEDCQDEPPIVASTLHSYLSECRDTLLESGIKLDFQINLTSSSDDDATLDVLTCLQSVKSIEWSGYPI